MENQKLSIGLQIMHRGIAMELLFRRAAWQGRETWRVKLLFVEPREIDEIFYPHDTVTLLHTSKRTG